MPFGNYQNEIYLRGAAGIRPRQTVDLDLLEAKARSVLPAGPLGYIAGGAGRGKTMKNNADAFDRWGLVPRMLHGVADRSMARTVLGTQLIAPVMLAPIGVQTLAHPDGELATARACAETGMGMVMSTASAHTFEQMGEACGDAPHWYQLYYPKDRTVCRSFVERAEASGATALVVTLDTTLLGWRPADLDQGYLPFLWREGNVNFFVDPAFRALLPPDKVDDPQMNVAMYAWQFANPGLVWDDIAFLREVTTLPIVLKGIQRVSDARLAVEHGVDGIVVSNHGGRQVDGAVGSLQVLPEIVDAVGADLTILFDSGIRSGSDALKALALGAEAIFLGRPYIYGLATGGQQGVVDVIRAFLSDMDLQMALSGHASVDELTRESLTRIG